MSEAAHPIATAGETAPGATFGSYDVAEELLAGVIERSRGSQLRVYALRMIARDSHTGRRQDLINISVSRWFKDPGDRWRSDRKPWKGGPLLFPSEILLVAAAMQRAVQMARELGWGTR